MVETYNGKSPRNARIKIDYTGECPSVQFKYPRKDGYVGSMRGPILLIWVVLLIIVFYSFMFGVSISNMNQVNDTQVNNTQVNETQIKDTQQSLEIAKKNLEQINKEIELANKKFNQSPFKFILVILIIFLPPIIINKLFKKKLNALFPVYQAWKTKKKYVTFKTKDIKTSNINGKKEIYIEIPYFENVILKYEATKDFSKYLDVMEIKEHNFKTEESHEKKKKKKEKKEKKKKVRKVKKQNEWYWNAKFYFNKVPKNGKLSVIFK